MRPRAAPGAILALAGALAREAAAQPLTLAPVFPYGDRADSVAAMVVGVAPSRGFAGDVVLRASTSWPAREATVRHAVSVPAFSSRQYVVPVPVGRTDYVRLSLGDDGSSATYSSSGSGTFARIAVVGLGERIAGALRATTVTGALVVAVGAVSAQSGDPLLPTLVSAYGGTDVVLAGTAALLAAAPEGRRALAEWVGAGGVLVLSPRSVADLRDPWLASLVGPVTDDGGGALTGPRLRCAEEGWACVAAHGLGSVAVMRHDLSLSGWASAPGAEADLAGLAGAAVSRLGGGVAAPGDLALFHKLVEPRGSSTGDAFRPPTDVRVALGPIAVLLTLYIIAVGVMLRTNRASAAPLRVFVRLPAMGTAVFFLVLGATYVARGQGNTARVLAVYDLAAGDGRATRRVFAGLTAGRPVTIAVAPPAGAFAVLRAGTDSASGALRWDGARVVVERARLGLWETGVLYVEGPDALGGGIALSRDDSGRPVVENRTALALARAVYVEQGGGAAWDLPAIPPGGRAVGAGSRRLSSSGASSWRLFGAARPSEALARTFLDEVVRDFGAVSAPGQLWAVARLPPGVRSLAPGFAVRQGEALVRVVEPSAAVARSRLGARTYEVEAIAPADPEDAGAGDDGGGGDAGGDAAAAQDAGGDA